MSLPSWAKFYYKGEEAAHVFVNCGHYYSDELVPGLFREILEEKCFPGIWDKVIMYGKEYSKEEVQDMLLTGIYLLFRDTSKKHHIWCNYISRPVEGCIMCKKLHEKYPEDCTPDEMAGKYFPDAVIRR